MPSASSSSSSASSAGAGISTSPRAPGQEGGHLGPGDRLVGAVAPRLAGAACGDAGRGQGVDVGLVEVACGVGEPGRVGGLEVERPLQERGHLGPVHRPVRAEPQRIHQAARGDLQIGQALDVGQPAVVGVDVGEARLGCGGRFGLVEDPHQPDRHSPALHLVAGAEHVLGALRAVEQAPLDQRINGRLVHPASHILEAVGGLHGPDGLGIRGLSGRHRRQPGYGDRDDYRYNPQPPDHGATLLNPDMPVRSPATAGHHDSLHISKTMDIVCCAFASRGSGSPHESVLKGSEAPARWKPTQSY